MFNLSALESTVFAGPKHPTQGFPLLVHFKQQPILVIDPKQSFPASNRQLSFMLQSLQNDKSFIGKGFCPKRNAIADTIPSGFGGHPEIYASTLIISSTFTTFPSNPGTC